MVANYSYDAWGNVTSVTDANGAEITSPAHIANVNPIRYRGYYYDSETGLYYVNFRYYDPAVKRFINSDDDLLSATSPQALTDKNYFAYCDNNPVTRADGEGDCWHIVIGAAVGGVISATTQVIDQGGIHNGKDIAKMAVAAVIGAIGGGIGATGIGLIASAGIDAGLTAVNDIGISLIDNDFNFQAIELKEVAFNVGVTAITSGITGGLYDKATKTIVNKSKSLIKKGQNKIVKGLTSKKTASKVKGSIKTGQRMIKNNRKIINRVNGLGSVIGSIVSGVVSSVKSFVKSFFKWR